MAYPEYTAQHSSHPGQQPLPSLQTCAPQHNTRFSYSGTPEPAYDGYSSPTNSSIDDSPLSPVTHHGYFPENPPEEPPSPYPEDKKRDDDIHSPYNLPPPNEIHPAHMPYIRDAAPINQERRESTRQPSRALSPSEEITSQVPINDANRRPPTIAHHNYSYNEPRTPKFNPHSFMGPDAAAVNHQPGQAIHANSAVDTEWRSGICDIDGICCMGLFCPCMLYGKTQYRLSQKSRKREATDLLEYKTCNSSCTLMALACGFQGKKHSIKNCISSANNILPGVLTLLQHSRVGRAYKLNTSLKSSCLKSFCCCCCVLMQDEREIRDREESIRQQQGLANTAYISPAVQMSYAPPPR